MDFMQLKGAILGVGVQGEAMSCERLGSGEWEKCNLSAEGLEVEGQCCLLVYTGLTSSSGQP